MKPADLDALALRIERLTTHPAEINAPIVRLVRPIWARLGYRPKVSIVATEALLGDLRNIDPLATHEKFLKAAFAELEDNLVGVERATVIGEKALVSYAAWLRRSYEFLVRAQRAIESPDDATAKALAIEQAARAIPPLVVKSKAAEVAQTQTGDPHASRLIDLELAAIDHVLTAAHDEVEVLGRRRRLFEAARQMLLECNAAIPLEAQGVEARRSQIAREMTRIGRLEAAGVNVDITMTHQIREAFTRKEQQRLHACLVAQNAMAAQRGDARTFAISKNAIAPMWSHVADDKQERAQSRSVAKSARDAFGSDLANVVKKTYSDARTKHKKTIAEGGVTQARWDAESAMTYYGTDHDHREEETLAALLAVDGAFEVGGALLPQRIEEIEKRYRAVRFPTQDLVLLPALDPSDIPDAIVDDPRSIVLDLAAGRLLARRFVHQEITRHKKIVMRAEVRVYVLDGSGSMLGPRSRMRDAIVTAELLTLERRLREGAKLARVSLFYRYFDTIVGPTVRVDSKSSIDLALGDVLGTVRKGGTDINAALLASIEQVRASQASDPELARAQIVLVTDGEAPVDEAQINAARAGLGNLPVGLSIIALGVENPALQRLVAAARKRGERAFYHFIPDAALEQIARGEIDGMAALHVPDVTAKSVTPAEMSRELESLVDEMCALGREREVAALEGLDAESAALGEVGLTTDALSEGEKARARSLYRDRRSLEIQFARWFPNPENIVMNVSLDVVEEDIEATVVALSAVAEIISVTQGGELARRADAIDLLERLLPDAQLSPARYLAVVARPTKNVHAALIAVRRSVTVPT